MVDDGAALSNQRKAPKGAFIPMKQSWLDQVATDPKLTPAALRVAILLSNGFNSETLETFIGRNTLARKLGIAATNVSSAVRLLKEHGHVVVRAVGRNNHYRMVLGTGATTSAGDPDKERTGMNIDTSQVLKTIPNRYEDQYPNREDNISTDSAVGAYAPNGVTSERVLKETRTPEGARLSEQDGSDMMTSEEALQEIIDAYPGPCSDRDEAMSSLIMAWQDGVTTGHLLFEARHAESDEELHDFIFSRTRASGSLKRSDIPF